MSNGLIRKITCPNPSLTYFLVPHSYCSMVGPVVYYLSMFLKVHSDVLLTVKSISSGRMFSLMHAMHTSSAKDPAPSLRMIAAR